MIVKKLFAHLKIYTNVCFLNYFDLIFYQRPTICVFGHTITVMSKNPTGTLKIIPKHIAWDLLEVVLSLSSSFLILFLCI